MRGPSTRMLLVLLDSIHSTVGVLCSLCTIYCKITQTHTPTVTNTHTYTHTVGTTNSWVFSSILTRGFSKNLLFKSYGMKKPICKQDRAHREPFSRTFGTIETHELRTTSRSTVASYASYWCNRRKTSEIRIAKATACSGLHGHTRTCAVYERPPQKASTESE